MCSMCIVVMVTPLPAYIFASGAELWRNSLQKDIKVALNAIWLDRDRAQGNSISIQFSTTFGSGLNRIVLLFTVKTKADSGHIWWPIYINNYVRASCFLTQATLSRFQSSLCRFSCRRIRTCSLSAIFWTTPSTFGSSSITRCRHSAVLLCCSNRNRETEKWEEKCFNVSLLQIKTQTN